MCLAAKKEAATATLVNNSISPITERLLIWVYDPSTPCVRNNYERSNSCLKNTQRRKSTAIVSCFDFWWSSHLLLCEEFGDNSDDDDDDDDGKGNNWISMISTPTTSHWHSFERISTTLHFMVQLRNPFSQNFKPLSVFTLHGQAKLPKTLKTSLCCEKTDYWLASSLQGAWPIFYLLITCIANILKEVHCVHFNESIHCKRLD